MSRGGRINGRGRGSGRGGFGGPFSDPDLKPDYSVSELFPAQPVPSQSAIKKHERIIVARYQRHRERIHHGPLYTILDHSPGIQDTFNDIAKYSEKYRRPLRKMPKLDARPYVLDYFPVELYYSLGLHTAGKTESEKPRNKTLHLSVLDSLNILDISVNESDLEHIDEDKEAISRLQRMLDGDMGLDDGQDANEEEEDEEPDEFDDDEEGDYNAEGYFDDGDDMGMGDGFGGDEENWI